MLSLTAASRNCLSVFAGNCNIGTLAAGDEELMNCSECRDLYRVMERRNARYVEARSAAFFKINPRLAARKHVDLQRAISDLQEHQAECPWAITAEHLCQRANA
jgi:hypothetical protein